MRALFLSIILLIWPLMARAGSLGLGQVAQNVIDPVSIFADFMQTGCIVIGASFLFACLIKYIEHRRSPLQVPMSKVIFLLVAGLILIILPFLSMLAGSSGGSIR